MVYYCVMHKKFVTMVTAKCKAKCNNLISSFVMRVKLNYL